MSNFITTIEVFVYLCTRYFAWAFVLGYIISHAAYIYYFWASGISYPILGIIPCVRAFWYYSMGGVSRVLIGAYCVLSFISWYMPIMFIWLIYIAISVWMEWCFASVCIDNMQWLYALCPPYRWFVLIRDARRLQAE